MTWIVPDDWTAPPCSFCGREWTEGDVWKLSLDMRLICSECYDSYYAPARTIGTSMAQPLTETPNNHSDQEASQKRDF